MRTALLTYLSNTLTGSIKVSNELPWEQGVVSLPYKNMKHIYIDEPTVEMNSLIPILNGVDINETVTKIRGYLVVDAKNRNADLDTALATLNNAKTAATIPSSFRKEFTYSTKIDGEKSVFEFEYRFHNLD